jgi:hypothetical protein
MAENTTPDYPKGVTFEQVWAMFQETARRQEETDRLMKEQSKETAERFKEAERLISENGKQIGGLHNRFGEIAEHLVAPGIVKKFNELGFHFDAVASRGMVIHDAGGKIKAEIDLSLENGEAIIAVEVKARVVKSDIEHHTRRLEILKEYRRKWNDSRKIYGAIAGAVFGSSEKEAALGAGFYVLGQSGDTMTLEIPEGFAPREW